MSLLFFTLGLFLFTNSLFLSVFVRLSLHLSCIAIATLTFAGVTPAFARATLLQNTATRKK